MYAKYNIRLHLIESANTYVDICTYIYSVLARDHAFLLERQQRSLKWLGSNPNTQKLNTEIDAQVESVRGWKRVLHRKLLIKFLSISA